MGNYLKYPKDRKKYPTDEADPEHFYSDNEVREMIKNYDDLEFEQNDYLKLYN